MQINYRSFPHPVLSPFSDDLVGCAFQCAVQPTQEGHEYKFEAVARVSSEQIASLIEAGDAVYGVHVECPATRYRSIWKFADDKHVFRIPLEVLEGRVQVCAFILATTDISRYANKDFHPDYDGTVFPVRRGDILAVDECRTFLVERREDPLRRIPSIFTVATNTSPDPPALDVDLIGDKVVIKLSPENYGKYLQLRQDAGYRSLLNALIVLPALVYVLDEVNPERASREGSLERFDQRWYRALRRKLEERGVRLDSEQGFRGDTAVNLASRLIGNPLAEGLEVVVRLAGNEE